MSARKKVRGEWKDSLDKAIEDAFDRLGDDADEGTIRDIDVRVEHHSPSHIKQWRVTVEG